MNNHMSKHTCAEHDRLNDVILKLLLKCKASTKFSSRTADILLYYHILFLILTSAIEEKVVLEKYLGQPTKLEY